MFSFQSTKSIASKTSINLLRHYCTRPNTRGSLSEIREQFKQFQGGRLSLEKNENSGIALIKIDHVEKKNGFSGKMMVDFNDIVTELENWKTGKGVILYGAGGTFCSGGYLDTVKKISNSEDGYRMSTLMHDTVLRLRNLPLISVTLITGSAVGGGAELTLSTDFRLMSLSSEIRFVEARMGVGTGWAGGTLLQKLLGRRTALELLLTCRKISPDEALVLGLADDVLDEKDGDGDEVLVEKTVQWLESRMKGLNYSVVQTVKGIINCDDFEQERVIFARTWGGSAQKEALSKNIKHR